MLENAEKAIRFVEGMKFEEFTEDEKTAYAVIRALEVIGEAVRKIPQDLRDMYPEVSRREIAGMKEKFIHEYFGVNSSVVWRTIQEDLLILIGQLNNVLNDFD